MLYYAVVDTNVLVSAMLKIQSIPWQIANEALLGDLIPLLSDEILAEYREVLARPKFKFNQDNVEMLIEGIIDRGIFMDAVPIDELLPDPKDIVFYGVVMGGRTQLDEAYLVTGNIKHFPVKPYIVTPKEMLEIMHKI
ncbi:MAG: putative toxin-antitoxin system toxin component, PIN family [Erysipelotrichaceae bacterium]